MLKSGTLIKPEELVNIVLKRRWFIIIPFCLSIIIGIYLAYTLPRIYKAETLILVEPQRVPTNYVQPIVSTDVNDRVSTLSQQIRSRSNLEKIINEFGLYSDPGQENMFIEDKIGSVRDRIKISLTRARGGSDAFSISFEGKHPEKVMKVANALATYFIDQNLKVRESQAIGTSSFFEYELEAKKKELEKIEATLKQYRQKYMGELPEQLDTNLSILNRLQDQISKKEEAIGNLRNNIVMLNNQQEVFQSTAETNLFLDGSDEMLISDGNGSGNLGQIKAQLEELRMRYTDRHPDIVRLKKMMDKIEAEKNKNAEKIDDETESKVTLNEEKMSGISFSDLPNYQKEGLDREIYKLRKEINELTNQVKIYQERVENTPKREQELFSLNRDYRNLSLSYESLLKRKYEAEIAVNMEKQQKGERFRILDYARMPTKPIFPDMKILFVLTLVLGIGVGGGLIFLIEYFNPSFRNPEDIESSLGISVIATLPAIYHQEQLRKQKASQFLSVFFIIVSFILFSGFAFLTFKGVDQTTKIVSRFITM